jgi:hypothetical protein
MSTRLEHTQALSPDGEVVGDAGGIPTLSHEAEFIRWVTDNAVNAVVCEVAELLTVVAVH